MRIIILAPLVTCLAASFATAASAKPRKHVRHHTQVQAQNIPQFQPVTARWPDGPMMQPLMMMPQPTSQQPRRLTRAERSRMAPKSRVSGAQVSAKARMAYAARPDVSAPDAAASAPASFGGGSPLVAEARRWMGGNPTGRSSAWCGNFMNLVLQRTGHRASPSNQARSFASYGRRLPGPQVGAIAVMSRGRNGGHVGVVSGIDPNGNPIIISGNHGRKVGEGVYPRSRVYAYVMP
jgi:uncharacterized protein (TIGR02594 family)